MRQKLSVFSDQTEAVLTAENEDRSSNKFYRYKLKRFLDVLITIPGTFLLSPLFILIAILIKVTSPGPVIFNQVRIGKNGKSFIFYKFRTMTGEELDDDERKKRMIKYITETGNGKVKTDGRVTKIGKILRKTSLDELPQLFNVIKGEMTLVGPRPCLPYEYESYNEHQKKRLGVVPGCTGLWQVSWKKDISFEDSILLDLYYISNISFVLDLIIIIKTIPVMMFAKGSG